MKGQLPLFIWYISTEDAKGVKIYRKINTDNLLKLNPYPVRTESD